MAPQEAPARPPTLEDYATVEAICDGVPVYSFDNIVYVYGQSPDLLPALAMQEGNTHPNDISPRSSEDRAAAF